MVIPLVLKAWLQHTHFMLYRFPACPDTWTGRILCSDNQVNDGWRWAAQTSCTDHSTEPLPALFQYQEVRSANSAKQEALPGGLLGHRKQLSLFHFLECCPGGGTAYPASPVVRVEQDWVEEENAMEIILIRITIRGQTTLYSLPLCTYSLLWQVQTLLTKLQINWWLLFCIRNDCKWAQNLVKIDQFIHDIALVVESATSAQLWLHIVSKRWGISEKRR